MYALSPLMGWTADRIGGGRTALGGLVLLFAAVALSGLGQTSLGAVTVGLLLLGLGWSAATVSAAALLVDAVPPHQRVTVQGLCDATMSAAGALGSIGAGAVMEWAGFGPLNFIAAVLLATTCCYACVQLNRHRRSQHARPGPPRLAPADSTQPDN